MKIAIGLIFFIAFMLLTSCAMNNKQLIVPDFSSKAEASAWIFKNIKYVSDYDYWKVQDRWQTPQETLDLRHGDCEDMAILFLAVADQDFGEKGSLVMTECKTTGYHAFAVDGNIYDPTWNSIGQNKNYKLPYVWTWDYDTAMTMAANKYSSFN
jgi:hypothetical protein